MPGYFLLIKAWRFILNGLKSKGAIKFRILTFYKKLGQFIRKEKRGFKITYLVLSPVYFL
jgi:hypothetical protein